MPHPLVVNVLDAPYDVYVGRGSRRLGIASSPLGNPYTIGEDGTRAEVIQQYRDYLGRRPDLVRLARELRGKVLGCHCAPKPCHADLIAQISNAPEEAPDERGS